MAVGLFELIYVNVVAARIDDDFLGAPDDVERALLIKSSEVPRMQPSVAQYFIGGGLVAVLTRHNVGAARYDLTNAA